jgi:predicted porin
MNGLQFGVSYTPSADIQNNSAATGAAADKNLFAGSVAFSGDMGGASVAASVGVDHVANANTQGTTGADDDKTQYRVGVDVGVGGFGVNMSYAAQDYNTGTATQRDDWTAEMAVSYTMAQHTFGAEIQFSESDRGTAATADFEAKNFALDYVMDIGNGVTWDAHLAFLDIDQSGGNTTDVDTTIFVTGLGVSF